MTADKSPVIKKRPRWLKWTLWVSAILVVYTVTGFFIAPAILKSQLLKRLPAITKRQVAIEQVKMNPFALSLTIRGFSLKEANGEIFSSCGEFYVNLQLSSIFKRMWVFDEISITGPFAQVICREDRTFNFMNMIPPPSPSPPPKGPPKPIPALVIYRFGITNAGLAFTDLTRQSPFRTEFRPVRLYLTDLTTVLNGEKSPYTFTARTGAGEEFRWSGNVSINPPRSAGAFRVTGLKLGNYFPYSQDYARFQIADGSLAVSGDYRYDGATNMLDLVVSNGVVSLSNLVLVTPDTKETALSIPSMTIKSAEANVLRQTARVGEIKSSGGSLLARQNQDGTINLLSQLVTQPAAAAAAASKPVPPVATPPPSMPWSVKIDEIAFDNYALKAEDKKPAKAASFSIDQLGFDLKGVSNVSNAPVAAALSLHFQETGSVGVAGTVTLLPPSADLQIGVTNLDLRAVQPYVAEQVKLVITSGSLDVNGRARYSPLPATPRVSFAGDVALNKFATTDEVLFKDFAKWEALAVGGIKLTLQPDKLDLDQVKFTGLDASMIIGPDKLPNFASIARKPAGGEGKGTEGTPVKKGTDAAGTVPAGKPLPEMTLGALVFEQAALHFVDQSIEPHCSFTVEEFGGTIQGLSSQEQSTAVVALNGKVDARSPFTVTGKVNPLARDLFADIGVTFTNTELTSFSPYTEKFAGRPLQKGKLSFGVHYLVNKKDLKAENGFYVDQLTLGPKNNSPDATKLPVKLAIALLKDRRGRIQLDVPVQGRIDDPKFALGPIIWQVVENLIVKAATSPFTLLGSLFGGGEELSYVDFQPGVATLGEPEIKKLDTLAKALYERPELSLEINGSVDPAKDREALAKLKFTDQIKALWLKEQTDAGNAARPLAEITLEPADYERLVRKTWRETLGTNQPAGPGDSQTTNAPTAVNASPTNHAARGQIAALSRPGTNSPATKTAPLFNHGASFLLRTVRSEPSAKALPVAPLPGAVAAISPAEPVATGPVSGEPEFAGLELQLIKTIKITDDDLRDLMQARANQVQSQLLGTQKVTAERLFIIAPKPLDAAFKGEERANMTLN